jgi:hypothetical protein
MRLPERYRVLPYITTYRVPEFQGYSDGVGFSFCPVAVEMDEGYQIFVERVRSALGRKYLPVCRLADGEFKPLFWPVAPTPRHPLGLRLKHAAHLGVEMARLIVGGFKASTAPGVSSGQFHVSEWPRLRKRCDQGFVRIGQEGILALHLGVAVTPFQEHYFPAIKRWLSRRGLQLSIENYVPFYFVYALLRGSAGQFLFDDTRVLVVHCATGARRDRVIEAIQARGARSVDWIAISESRSFAEQIDASSWTGRCDVCFVGAGVGKAVVMEQLRPLGVPVIDAGYVFEVWADERRAASRVMMTPDAST